MALSDIFNSYEGQQALGLLAAGGARSDGAGFGQRLLEGLGQGDKWKQQQQAQALQKIQMDNYLSEIEQRKAATAKAAQLQEMAIRKQQALPGLWTGGRSAISALAGDSESGILPSAGRAAVPGTFDTMRALQEGYTPEEIQKLVALKDVGRQEVARTVKGMQNGREVEQQFDKYGGEVGKGMEQFRAPIEVATGDRKQFVDPYTLAPKASFSMGQSPDSKASNAVAWANNSLANQRFAFDKQGGADSGGSSQMDLNRLHGKPQAGYRWKPDGSLEFIPGGPADQKAQGIKVGEGTVAGLVADLRDKYTQLDANNGIVSTNNLMGTNLGAAFGASPVGQTLNGMFGTQTQSLRDSVNMTRPLLLQAIMKATGMSAKQMDSNAELKLYLSTATDPTKGLEANMAAIDRIESLYGGGGESFNSPRPVAPSSSGWKIERAN